MNSKAHETVLVCNMGVFTPAERNEHIQNTIKLFQSVQDIQEAENGYEFFFSVASVPETIIKLAEFISNERLCCPFLEFTLTISLNTKPISLLLTGPAGIQEFLREEFSEAFA